jgi:hypothetical protein
LYEIADFAHGALDRVLSVSISKVGEQQQGAIAIYKSAVDGEVSHIDDRSGARRSDSQRERGD